MSEQTVTGQSRSASRPSPTYKWAVIPLKAGQVDGTDVQWFRTRKAADNHACRYGVGECAVARLFQ